MSNLINSISIKYLEMQKNIDVELKVENNIFNEKTNAKILSRHQGNWVFAARIVYCIENFAV